MESHTLEILQQGVWASLTGGWFYDFRQNAFCNTFHLYLWLFLLCFPFILNLYFVPNVIIYSFYCGTIGILFTTLKLINHRLHKLFDTAQWVQGVVPDEALPESQKNHLWGTDTDNTYEDEGIELQVLNEPKLGGELCNDCSFNEPTDNESIISAEAQARNLSGTIDLKVDVHRKNSSESLENLSLNPVQEYQVKALQKTDESDWVKNSNENSLKAGPCNLRCNSTKLVSTKFRIKPDEKISGLNCDDYILSQSDCHIAEQRRKNLEETIIECRMSHSECHISNISKALHNPSDNVQSDSDLFLCIGSQFKMNDAEKNQCLKTFSIHRAPNSQSNAVETLIEKNISCDIDDKVNSSYDILPMNPGIRKDTIVNTGSLELPLKGSGTNAAICEKGLLYWKQHNLTGSSEATTEDASRKKYSRKKLKTTDLLESYAEEKGSEKPSAESQTLEREHLRKCPTSEKSVLEILEENFDWCGGDYQCYKTIVLPLAKKNGRLSDKFKKREDVTEMPRRKSKSKFGLKFQVDSDEDLSDNRGSQSPLLCKRKNSKEVTNFSELLLSSGLCDHRDCQKTGGDSKKNSFFLLTDCSPVAGAKVDGNDKEMANFTLESENVPLENWDEEDLSLNETDDSAKETGKIVETEGDSFLRNVSIKRLPNDSVTEISFKRRSFSGESLEKNCDRVDVRFDRRGAIPKIAESKVGENDWRNNDELFRNPKWKRSTTLKVEIGNETSREEQADTHNEVDCLGFFCEEGIKAPDARLCLRRGFLDSSCSSANSLLPLSSLLSSPPPPPPPPSPLLTAFLARKKDSSENKINSSTLSNVYLKKVPDSEAHQNISLLRHKKNRRLGKRQGSSRISSIPLFALTSMAPTDPGIHLAASHDDTSPGAVHCFQDERGCWMSYIFESINADSGGKPSLLKEAMSDSGDSTVLTIKNMDIGADAFKNTEYQRENGWIESTSKPTRVQGYHSRHEGVNSSLSYGTDYVDDTLISRIKNYNVEMKNCERDGRETALMERFSDPEQNPLETADCGGVARSSEFDSENKVVTLGVDASDMLKGVTPPFSSFAKEHCIVNKRNAVVKSMIFDKSTCPSDSGFLSKSELGFHISHPFGNISGNDDYNNNNNSNMQNNSYGGSDNGTNSNSNLSYRFKSINNNNNDFSVPKNNIHSNESADSVLRQQSQSRVAFERNKTQSITFSAETVAHEEARLPGTELERENDRNHFELYDLDDVNLDSERKIKSGHYQKLYVTPWNFVKIRFDRLELTALLDRNLTVAETSLSLFLSLAVSACGMALLNSGFYRDLFAFLFCFALAGCQYSLLKSVQPDATSPTHGYNRIVVYSRSIYFCITSLLIFLLNSYLDNHPSFSFRFYCVHFTNNNSIRMVRDGLVMLLLFFPVFFTLGLFPQINTFCLYALEQIDVHAFGGNAMSSLLGAGYCILRSVAAFLLVYGFAYGALSEVKASQHILFSIFCGVLISVSYHLSRSSSNPNVLWDILKDQFFQEEISEKRVDGDSAKRSTESRRFGKSNDVIGEIRARTTDPPVKEAPILRHEADLMKNHRSGERAGRSKKNNACKGPEPDAVKVTFGRDGADPEDFVDPLPAKLKDTVNARLRNDVIACTLMALLVFGLHSSAVFTTLQPDLNPILWGIAGCSGLVLHYVVPELRKHLPWLCLTSPMLKCQEHAQFEVKKPAKIMWFEETYVVLCFLEKNLLYPVLVLATMTYDGPRICDKYGVPVGALFTCLCGLKIMRSAFSNPSQQYLIVIFSALIFEFDYYSCSETFLLDYFFIGIIFSKAYEFLLKVQFIVIYIAPWQITWGSAFHAFAQPFSVPHSAMLFVQAALSAVLSAPLNPFLGSAIFLASYVRPIKFWERDYNTRRVDHSNTRMSSHLERNLGSDDNNLNSIFYEHLTRSLQHNLCGDLELGRWGPVHQGDCFVLASDYLNCLVHIIEMGNGLVTFQMRGLEFRGTYCQQREVEAISERVEDDDGCCCCEPCHVSHFLSVNAAFSKRWLAWEVIASKYVLEGYSISDNSAASTLQVFDFRKVLVTYYVKSIIFYCVRSPKLDGWLTNPTILAALEPLADRSFVDLDPVFNVNIDQDFDSRTEGITRNSFCSVYSDWIRYCCSKRDQPLDKNFDSLLVSLCLALSLIGRRTLGTASHNTVSSVEFFLYGLHALFKGDFRITSIRDDWIFADMEFLTKVIAPGVRMSLKLHQDHFMSPDEYEDPGALFDAISTHEKNLVISHEGDPAWRGAILSGKSSLLALRHVLDDGSDEYKIIMLNKRFLSFRVIKLNRECVRGLWAGQQQELVFLRNRNPERGSIQNAKQVLRNIINSSCDQPIGYPIYVSPLTTSYSDTNTQLTGIIGGPLSLQGLKTLVLEIWKRIGRRCREGCSSGSGATTGEEGLSNHGQEGYSLSVGANAHSGYNHVLGTQSVDSNQVYLGSSNRRGSLRRNSSVGRGSLPSAGKPSSATLASLAGLLTSNDTPKVDSFFKERETSFVSVKDRQNREEREGVKRQDKEEKDSRRDTEKMLVNFSSDFDGDPNEKESVYQRVRIIHPNLVFDAINLGRRIDVLWPDEEMRLKGGRSYWKDWLPDSGMEGHVVHRWVPNHRNPARRSHVDKTILLVKIDDKFVPIAETGVQNLGVEV